MLVKHNPFETYPAVAGHSAQWNDARERGARVAGTATTVRITGESGTGKDVLARDDIVIRNCPPYIRAWMAREGEQP